MRKNIHEQYPIVIPWIEHQHADELRAIDDRLNACPAITQLVWEDLVRGVKNPDKGRRGLSADTVLRALMLKQMHHWSYERLAFHLLDSKTFRRFCKIELECEAPKRATLQANIKKVGAKTLEKINHLLLGGAAREGIEKGRKVRVDCTAEETNIHEPMDSEQLWDCVRVLTRLLHRSQCYVDFTFTNHTRRAKRRRKDAWNAKGPKKRKPAYIDLIKVTRKTVKAAQQGVQALQQALPTSDDVARCISITKLTGELTHYIHLAARVIDQAHRRVVLGEEVPAEDKVLSIFEPHTDIIKKGGRDIEYGHKLCISTGASGLVLDLVIEKGNPNDSTLAVRSVERQKDIYGRVPRQVAFDGGFASETNLKEIKAAGVTDVSFNKRKGLKVSEMVRSEWVYRQLYKFRAGVEAGISFLKRCFGLRRCMWKGLESFEAYSWASVLSANLIMLARHTLAAENT